MNIELTTEVIGLKGKTIDFIHSKFIRFFWKDKDLLMDKYENLRTGVRTKSKKGFSFLELDGNFYYKYIFDDNKVQESEVQSIKQEMLQNLGQVGFKYSPFTIEIA